MTIELTREIVPERKFRVHQWIDTARMEPMFGIQTNLYHRKWAHVVAGDKPAMFGSRAEAEDQIKAWKSNAAGEAA